MTSSIVATSPSGSALRRELGSLLSSAQQEAVRAEANAWIKRLRLVTYGDRTMRERFRYREDSLWWFTELYLHKMRRLERAIATLFALEAAVEQLAPARLAVETDDYAVAVAARVFAATRGVSIDVPHIATGTRERHVPGLLVGLSTMVSRLRPSSRQDIGRARIAAFVHSAFWRAGESETASRENYVGAVLEAIEQRVPASDLRWIGLGPRRTFRQRKWWDPLFGAPGGPEVPPIEALAPREALTGSLDVWRRRNDLARDLVTGDDIRAAGFFGEYDLWPLLRGELEQVARVQWPWSARAIDEATAAIAATGPKAIVTYAEAGGWGRALMIAARRQQVPSVGLQHGFIYRHWLNYGHEPDEMQPMGDDAGFPRPDLTLLFDGYAAATLETTGNFQSDTLRITGSPRLDELVVKIKALSPERPALRRSFGLSDTDQLAVLAAKASEIRPHLRALFDAASSLPNLKLIVKPHPAETADAYRGFIHDSGTIVVASAGTDLGRLLAAADAVVTMNSTVAIDCLVLGVPALVVGLPNNLSPFVEAGVMVGAADEDIRSALEGLLYDRPAREAIVARAAEFAARHRMQGDGGAAGRAAEAILALAR